MKISGIIPAVALMVMAAGHAEAKDITVKMLNRSGSSVMVFEPNFVRAAPGDKIVFVPTDKGHNAETIPGMIPAGAKPFKSSFGQPFSVTLTKPGVYGFKCMPHYAMGMVGMIVVGSPTNLPQAKTVKHFGKAQQVFTMLFQKAAAVK